MSKIMRAIRKEKGLSQKEIAEILGFSQSDVSRFEHGRQTMSAAHWLHYCETMQISSDSAGLGYYERPSLARLGNENDPNPFNLPKMLTKERGSKVRSSRITMQFFAESFGDAGVLDFLSAKKVDPDFFVNLDNQINAEFPTNLISTLVRKKKINKENIHLLSGPVATPLTHGQLHHRYDSLKKNISLIRSLAKNIKFYDCNFEYQILHDSEESIDLSIMPNLHMRGILKKNADVGDVFCHYMKSLFSTFSEYGGSNPIKVHEQECFYKGSNRCVYEFKV